MSAVLPPWHQALWRPLAKALVDGRLGHALLLVGPAGAGKRIFARALAGMILCRQRQPDGSTCGRCSSCRLFAAGSHPDVFQLEKAEGSKVLKVDDLREFNRRLFLTAQAGGGRIGFIDPVHELNRSSANALLKSLEEPPPRAHLILIGERWHSLPATVRSRCQIIRFALPAATEARQWLDGHLVEGADDPSLAGLRRRFAPADGAAQEWLVDFSQLCAGDGDPIALAKKWESLDERIPQLAEQLHHWTRELLKLKAGSAATALPLALRDAAKNASGAGLHQLASLVVETRALLETQAKPQMLLENFLTSWYQTLAATTKPGPKALSR